MNESGSISQTRRALETLRTTAWCLIAYCLLQLGLASTASWLGSLDLPRGVWRSNRPALNLWLLGSVEISILGGLSLIQLSSHTSWFGTSTASTRPWGIARALVLGLLVGLALKIPADALRELIEWMWPTPIEQQLAQEALLQHDNLLETATLFLVVGLLGPIVEEVFYRGPILGSYERNVGRFSALCLSSIAFALSHASARDWLPLGVVALALGYLRSASSGLWASITAHAAFNSAAIVLLISDVSVQVTQSWLWRGLAVLSILVCWFLLRRIDPDPKPLRRAGVESSDS
jgi:membrane protease YdiL (CAAX protease family)